MGDAAAVLAAQQSHGDATEQAKADDVQMDDVLAESAFGGKVEAVFQVADDDDDDDDDEEESEQESEQEVNKNEELRQQRGCHHLKPGVPCLLRPVASQLLQTKGVQASTECRYPLGQAQRSLLHQLLRLHLGPPRCSGKWAGISTPGFWPGSTYRAAVLGGTPRTQGAACGDRALQMDAGRCVRTPGATAGSSSR